MLIKPGEKIALNGEVVERESPVNEAILMSLSTVIVAINAKFVKIAT